MAVRRGGPYSRKENLDFLLQALDLGYQGRRIGWYGTEFFFEKIESGLKVGHDCCSIDRGFVEVDRVETVLSAHLKRNGAEGRCKKENVLGGDFLF